MKLLSLSLFTIRQGKHCDCERYDFSHVLFKVVSKDSFEGSEAGLFNSNNANKAEASEICGIPCAENSKPLLHVDLQMAFENVDVVHSHQP